MLWNLELNIYWDRIMLKNDWNAIWRRNKRGLKTWGEFALFWNAITAVHSYNLIVRDLPNFSYFHFHWNKKGVIPKKIPIKKRTFTITARCSKNTIVQKMLKWVFTTGFGLSFLFWFSLNFEEEKRESFKMFSFCTAV